MGAAVLRLAVKAVLAVAAARAISGQVDAIMAAAVEASGAWVR